MSDTLLQLNSNSLRGTLACLRYRKNPSSSGLKMSSACPLPPESRKKPLDKVDWFSDRNSGTIPRRQKMLREEMPSEFFH